MAVLNYCDMILKKKHVEVIVIMCDNEEKVIMSDYEEKVSRDLST